MADEFSVTGADQFLRLSKALKEAGRLDLRRELNTGLRRAARPLVAHTRDEARRRLPKKGGLAERVARSPVRVQVRTGAKTAGVRLVAGKRGGAAAGAEKGVIRHPVFGNREVWVSQKVEAGWFSDPLRKGAPTVRPELEKALETIAEKVVNEAKH